MVVSNRNLLFQGSIFRGKLLVSGRLIIDCFTHCVFVLLVIGSNRSSTQETMIQSYWLSRVTQQQTHKGMQTTHCKTCIFIWLCHFIYTCITCISYQSIHTKKSGTTKKIASRKHGISCFCWFAWRETQLDSAVKYSHPVVPWRVLTEKPGRFSSFPLVVSLCV